GFLKLWQYPQIIADQNQPEYWAKQDLNGASSFVAFSPDGRTLARIGPDGLKLYNTPQPGSPALVTDARKAIGPPPPLAKGHFTCVTFSKDSKTMFVGGSDGVIYLYSTESGEPTGTFKGHHGEIRALAFNPTGNLLASASADYTVRLWGFDVVLQARDFPV